MKKILLSMLFLLSASISLKLYAQACTLQNLVVTLTDATDVNGECDITMKIEFDMDENGGAKYTWINIWSATDYDFINVDYTQKGPTLDQLNGADNTHAPIAVIGISKEGTLSYISTYAWDSGITPLVGTSITRQLIPNTTIYHYVLEGLTTSVPGACVGLTLEGDVWGTQAQGDKNPPKSHCGVKGITFYEDPTIRGAVDCTTPRTFSFTVTTISNAQISGNYSVYLDYGTPFVKDPADVLVSGPTNFSFSSNYQQDLIPYTGNIGDTKDQPLLLEFNITDPVLRTVYEPLDNPCITLPVKLKSFTASRKQTNVELKWTTTMEQNNSGFELQRQSGAGGWQRIGFVNSKATDGNSTSDLNYNFTDANDSRGVSQYRLMQVDHDDNAKYSEIRSVQGIGQEARTIISPNPSANGRVNVTFQSASSKKDLQLTDMHGRMLKQWNAYSDNSLQITDLTPGIYQLRITDRETGTQTVEKIMVVNR